MELVPAGTIGDRLGVLCVSCILPSMLHATKVIRLIDTKIYLTVGPP